MANNKTKPRLTHLDEKVLQVPFEKYTERKKICSECYAYKSDGICDITKININIVSKLKSSGCPLGFWSTYYGL
jgi:protein-arginine kinase activator protein McsA